MLVAENIDKFSYLDHLEEKILVNSLQMKFRSGKFHNSKEKTLVINHQFAQFISFLLQMLSAIWMVYVFTRTYFNT